MLIGFPIAGLVVGFIVGMTGIGGGSLMTPILLAFGVNPATAVGSDLLYAAVTKSGGIIAHQRMGNIDWRITRLLAYGSLPAAMLTLFLLSRLHTDAKVLNQVVTTALAIALLMTAFAILGKRAILQWAQQRGAQLVLPPGKLAAATILVGVVLGVLVTLSSIGAGALGTVALLALYPLMPTSRLVGTEIAHAVPLTLIAGLAHASAGHVNWPMLALLLCGSLPGIFIGSRFSGSLPDHYLRPALAMMLIVVSSILIYKVI